MTRGLFHKPEEWRLTRIAKLLLSLNLKTRRVKFLDIVLCSISKFCHSRSHRSGGVFSAILGLMTLFASQQAGAETQYGRGIWYDLLNVDEKELVPEVEKLYSQGVRSVHIMLSEDIFQKSIHCVCNTQEVRRFMYKDYTESAAVDATKTYHECLSKNLKNKFCDFAENYGFEFDWASFSRLNRFIGELDKRKMEVIITVWPKPTEQYIEIVSVLSNYLKKNNLMDKIYGIELEDEENWTQVFTPGGTKTELDQEARKLLDKVRSEFPASIKIGVTTAPRGFFKDRFTNDVLLNDPRVEFISFQAYQDTHVVLKTKDNIPILGKNNKPQLVCGSPSLFSGNASPSKLAVDSIALIGQLNNLKDKNLIVGLSAYQMDCPENRSATGLNGTINMYLAAKAAICAAKQQANDDKGLHIKIVENAYFSEKNAWGQRDAGNVYAHNFLSLCQARVMGTHCEELKSEKAVTDGNEEVQLQLNRDCPNIINYLKSKTIANPGATPAGSGNIYIYRNNL
jgi:hypothetical protein